MKRIFVSSTFRDMQYERDLFHTEIAPKLNEYARRYSENISFCDLRWGINTGNLDSENGSKKVLSVCLDEIDRCDKSGSMPYIIVLLGNRYGWIPDGSLMKSATQRKNFVLENLKSSVTALEIEYGALRDREHLDRTLFYFREFEDELPRDSKYAVDGSTDAERAEYEKRLKELKEKICKITGNRVRTYRVRLADDDGILGLEAFSEMVIEDVRGLLEKEWMAYKEVSPHEKLIRSQWNITEQKSMQFGARADLAEDIVARIRKNCDLIGICGKTGSGKSTLMSRLANRLREESFEVLPLYCTSHTQLNQATDVMRCIVYDLEERMHCTHLEEKIASSAASAVTVEEWRERLAELAVDYDGPELVVMVDAVDQLFGDEFREKMVFLPTKFSKKLRFVVSFLEGYGFPENLAERAYSVSLGALERGEIVKSVKSILSYLGRELEPDVIAKILEKKSAANPLYLSLIIQRLVMMDKHDFESIHARGDSDRVRADYKIEIIRGMSDSLTEVCYDIINEASLRIGGDFSKKALEYIALTQSGLRESDLEEILIAQGVEWNALDFSLLINYLQSFFMMRDDGRISFTHRTIKEGILAHCADKAAKHLHIRRHLHRLQWTDPVSLDETVYQCYHADDKEYFVWYAGNIVKDGYNTAVNAAAKSFYELVSAHGDAWLMEILSGFESKSLSASFYEFFYIHVRPLFDQSAKNYETIVSILQAVANRAAKACTDNSPEFINSIANINLHLGNCFSEIQRYDMAEKYYLEAMRFHSLLPANGKDAGKYDRDLAQIHNYYALLLNNMRQPMKAMEYFKSSLAMREGRSPQDTQLAIAYHNIAYQYYDNGQHKEAVPYFQRAIDILEKCALGDEKNYAQNLILFNSKAALNYHRLNQKEQSISYINKAVALTEKYMLQQPEEYELTLCHRYNEKGIILSDSSGNKESIECYKQAIRIMEKYFKKFPEKYERALSTFYCNIAGEYAKNEKTYDIAEKNYVNGIKLREHLYSMDAQTTAMSLAEVYNDLGVFMTKQKRNGEARHYFLLAIDVSEKCSIDERYFKKANICQCYKNAAFILRKVLRPFKAKKYQSYADSLEKEMTFEEFKRFCSKKRISSKLTLMRAANDSLHPMIKLSIFGNIAFIFAFFYSVSLAESYGIIKVMPFLFVCLLVQYILGIFAAIAGSREVALTGKQKVKLFLFWYLSAGLATGWMLLHHISRAKQNIACGKSVTANRKAKHGSGKTDASALQKKIERLARENKKLEEMAKKVSPLKFRSKMTGYIAANAITSYLGFFQTFLLGDRLTNLGDLLFTIEMIKSSGSGPSMDFIISTFAGDILKICFVLLLYVALVAAHFFFAFSIIKGVWPLRDEKRIILLVLSICLCGIGTSLVYLMLYSMTFRSHPVVQTNDPAEAVVSGGSSASPDKHTPGALSETAAGAKSTQTQILPMDPVTLQLQKNKDEILLCQLELMKHISKG